MKYIILIVSIFTFNVFAETPKEIFCRQHASRAAIVANMSDYNNMLSVGNESGFLGMNTGVCWWHSRFQRNLSYLVQVDPTLPQPTDKEAKVLIQKIISGEEVVIIPGFQNFRMFCLKFQKFINKALVGWMNKDFLIKQEWFKAFNHDSILSITDFQSHMNEVYDDFKEADGLMFMMLKVHGPIAHAWLIAEMSETKDGWNLTIVDSISPFYKYKIFISDSASSIIPSGKFSQNKEYWNAGGSMFGQYEAVGYVYQKPELRRIKKVLSDYCAQ
jgi:hypothetical protein